MRAGVDDCGSGLFTGFACVILPARAAGVLEQRGNEALKSVGIDRFHGRHFNPDTQRDAYREFLAAVHASLSEDGAHGALQLYHKDHVDLEAFAKMVTERVLQELRGRTPRVAASLAGAMFFLCREFGQLRTTEPIDVELDPRQVDDAKNLARPFALAGNSVALLLDEAEALVRVSNGYKKACGFSGPDIASVVTSRGRLVQASDVIANFGLAWVKHCLRPPDVPSSERDRIRAGLFAETFDVEALPPGHGLSVAGSELRGGANANLRLVLSR